MKQIVLIILFCMSNVAAVYSQVDTVAVKNSNTNLDLKYREDQFYFGVNHNIMQDKLSGYSPSSVSLGIDFGFLRDFPINSSRTLAIAPGVGYSYSNLSNNLGLNELGEYAVLKNYSRSALSLHMLDIPLELRWRTSTPDSHKFWRIYLGVKASYIISDRLKTSTNSYTEIRKNDDLIHNWIYGTYLSVGFNTWNVYAYYGLSDLYKTNPIEGDPAKLRLLKFGLVFYIL